MSYYNASSGSSALKTFFSFLSGGKDNNSKGKDDCDDRDGGKSGYSYKDDRKGNDKGRDDDKGYGKGKDDDKDYGKGRDDHKGKDKHDYKDDRGGKGKDRDDDRDDRDDCDDRGGRDKHDYKDKDRDDCDDRGGHGNGHGHGHEHSNGNGHHNHNGWGWGHHGDHCDDDDDGGGIENDNPVLANGDSYTVSANGTISGNVATNDSVQDGLGAVTLVTDVVSGTLALGADGSFSFEPGDEFVALAEGEEHTETFTYQITDEDGDVDEATAEITIVGVNDVPVAEDAEIELTSADVGVGQVIDLTDLVSDPDGDVLTYGLLDTGGSAVTTSASNPLIIENEDGDDYAYVYLDDNTIHVTTTAELPEGAGFEISYTVTDTSGAVDLGVIGIEVVSAPPPG